MTTLLYPCGMIRALAVVILSGLMDGAPSAYAASAPSKKDPLQAVSQSAVRDPQTRAQPSKAPATKTLSSEPNQRGAMKQPSKKPPAPAARMARRVVKTRKTAKPVPMVQPKRDLSYHAILEPPQRYHLSREHPTGRLPTPQTGALLHDHFQELDKNHDGMIDPFERSLGRLDIDRDLSNHQWK